MPIESTAFIGKLIVWLLFLLYQTTDAATDATTDPPWKNKKYETMQNITNVIGFSDKNYFVPKGTFQQDIFIEKEVKCLLMKMDVFVPSPVLETYAYRKYRDPKHPKAKLDSYLYTMTHKSDQGYDVKNYANIEDEEQEIVENMHLVYTDYMICALMYHDKTMYYEIWLYKEPDGNATVCELLLSLLYDKPLHEYYMDDCPKY